MTTIDPAVVPEPNPFLVGEMSAQSLFDKCWTLARNLWWTWHPEVISLFRDLDPIRWRQLDHNPIALLREFTAERLAARAAEMVLYSRINYAHRRLKEYLANKQTWAAWNAGVLGGKPVAYFSAEFGLHESIPIYSGGLGVLSGDTSKAPAVWA
jgi:starch phosphorylase